MNIPIGGPQSQQPVPNFRPSHFGTPVHANEPSAVQFDPGQITPDDLNVLKRRRDASASELAAATADLKTIEIRTKKLARSEAWARRRLEFRGHYRQCAARIADAMDRSVSRIGGLIIALTAVLAMTLLAGFQFGESYFSAFAGLLALTAICVAAWFFIIATPPDEKVKKIAENAERELADLTPGQLASQRLVSEAQRRFDLSDADVRRAEQVLNSRLHRLLTCNWRALGGTPFEQFLGEVFSQLGYAVQMTGRAGDQGVDLIATAADRRIAVQAKGYVASVGNHSVMEVHTGMTYHGCHACVVITNSVFTRAAIECAQRVGCLLIDGSQIPSLIRGLIAI